jgi:hypothetical protein
LRRDQARHPDDLNVPGHSRPYAREQQTDQEEGDSGTQRDPSPRSEPQTYGPDPATPVILEARACRVDGNPIRRTELVAQGRLHT